MIYKISAEGAKFLYCERRYKLPESSYEGIPIVRLPQNDLWREIIFPDMSDTRLALMTLFTSFAPLREYVAYFLHWNDKTDLHELDKRVKESNYSNKHFANSVKTQFQKTYCPECSWSGYTLVMQTGDPYDGAPGLHRSKLGKRFDQDGFLKCPCGADFRIGVVKIFNNQ
jgi:hypothetical protein